MRLISSSPGLFLLHLCIHSLVMLSCMNSTAHLIIYLSKTVFLRLWTCLLLAIDNIVCWVTVQLSYGLLLVLLWSLFSLGILRWNFFSVGLPLPCPASALGHYPAQQSLGWCLLGGTRFLATLRFQDIFRWFFECTIFLELCRVLLSLEKLTEAEKLNSCFISQKDST